jgi:tetratricopeptide (TPR) repeat protein/tRNA A-37 threonylcarbamoyl transferase component Bud32
MSPDSATAYEQLTPEEAAQIDAVCDRFERAWKETKGGGPAPCLAIFMEHSPASARAVLLQELVALDQTCRERYGLAVGPQDSKELGVGAESQPISFTQRMGSTDRPVGRPVGWPSLPGLELVNVLGSGGMGVVFKARQAALDRDVAVKFLRDPHRVEPGQRERFLQEARAIARLHHPHLVQVYEFGEVAAAGAATSQPYLVLEYVSGGSLADLVRGSPQSPADAARLVETLADAIHYAHQQGVIHRDLKPANVLLSGEGRGARGESPDRSPLAPDLSSLIPKITDFGLAKFVLTGSDLTLSGELLGTPSYMAPEQISKSGPITAAVDVYGLGVILYEALTGRPPFAAATVEATLLLVRQDEPVPPRRLQPTVPRDLETICLKCLRKEAGRRYASAQDLADDLRRFRAGEPIRARPVGPGERVVAWCRRKPAVAGLLAALVLVFLAGSSGVLWQWQRARGNADAAEQNAAAFRRERDTAERRLKLVHDRVDELTRLGRDLFQRPGQYRTGQAMLEQALAFYQKMLPEEGNDPRVRREAAHLFGRVAAIHHTLGQADKAAENYGRQADLLDNLLNEEPTDQALRMELADSHRWRGNSLRLQGEARQARQAYDQARELHAGLVRNYPDEALYQMALANTLLNIAGLLSHWDQAEDIEGLYDETLKLYQTAVRTAPDNPQCNAELAFGLENQGLFFLDKGRTSDAEAAVREALEIHQRLRSGGHIKDSIERYLARNLVTLGRVLAAAGRAEEAEKRCRQAVNLLDRFVDVFPESARRRADQAQTLARLADLLKDPGRRHEVEEIRRRVIRHYEKLTSEFPEDPHYRRSLAQSYLELVNLLWELGRQSPAAELYRKALELESDDPDLNNQLAWFLATAPEPRLRDAGRALRLAKKAVDARPKSADYRNTLGVVHYRNGDDKAAIAELEMAMRLRAGGNSFDWFFLAMAYRRLGDSARAGTWFDRAVREMDRHKPHNDELRRLRAEAEATLADARKR